MMRALLLSAAALLALPAAAQDVAITNAKLVIGDGSAPIDGGVFALSFRPDGSGVAIAGEDGKVRFVNAADAKVAKEFIPVPLTAAQAAKPTAQLEPK